MSTIADVARAAGVSVSMVSHVFNGTRRVSSATASAVWAVIDATDYYDERNFVTGNASTASANEAAHALLLLPDPPTAIVTGNNMATIGAMQAVRARGLRVPADISIAGFDDFEWAYCFEPRLTIVAQPCEEIGRRAAFLLMERIAVPEGAGRTVRIDATLKWRDSCAGPQ